MTTNKIINLNKMEMRKRPTYEEIAKETVLESRNYITPPNRDATMLRNTLQLGQYDNPDFLDIEDTQRKIMANQLQAQTLSQVISQTPSATAAVTKAAVAPAPQPLKRAASAPIPAQAPFKQSPPIHPIPKGQPKVLQPPGTEAAAPAATLIADTGIDAEMAAASAEYSEQLKRAEQESEERSRKAAEASTDSLSPPTSVVQGLVKKLEIVCFVLVVEVDLELVRTGAFPARYWLPVVGVNVGGFELKLTTIFLIQLS